VLTVFCVLGEQIFCLLSMDLIVRSVNCLVMVSMFR